MLVPGEWQLHLLQRLHAVPRIVEVLVEYSYSWRPYKEIVKVMNGEYNLGRRYTIIERLMFGASCQYFTRVLVYHG